MKYQSLFSGEEKTNQLSAEVHNLLYMACCFSVKSLCYAITIGSTEHLEVVKKKQKNFYFFIIIFFYVFFFFPASGQKNQTFVKSIG